MAGVPILFRCGTQEEWESNNPVLFAGELGLVLSSGTEEQLMKIGNGSNNWNDLPWALRGPRGFDFDYTWDGTSLGVKHSDEAEYSYIDLGMYYQWNGTKLGVRRGIDTEYTEQELALDFDWDNTSLGIKSPKDVSYTYQPLGLEIDWRNQYELGIKREIDAEFTYVNLRGASFEYQWDGTQLGVRHSDEAEFTYVDLKGDTGPMGEVSAQQAKQIAQMQAIIFG